MTLNTENSQQYSGLILLTGVDKSGVANALFETLSPFAVSIIDIDQIVIKQRLILTVQILLNPDHREAIESDLNELSEKLQMDIASLFASSPAPREIENPVVVSIASSKMLPRYLNSISSIIHSLGGNIEKFERQTLHPLKVDLHISGTSISLLQAALSQLDSEGDATITVA
jgi:phosphoserine phosphatase